jgi:hypothetical protein
MLKNALSLTIGLFCVSLAAATRTPAQTAAASASPQAQCCVCSGGSGPFQVQQDKGCQIDCASNGGTATGRVTVCANNKPTVAAGKQPACDALTKTLDGDCHGNTPNICGIRVMVNKTLPPIYQMNERNSKDHPVQVGEILEFLVQGLPGLRGDSTGQNRGSLSLSTECIMKYGDGQSNPCEVGGTPPPKHAYLKPGVYQATVEVTSIFKNATCRYSVSSGVHTVPITVVAAQPK